MSEVILNIPKAASQDIRQFYDKYAGMLLGFIQGTIQDSKKSEEQLIKIITSFVLETNLAAESNLSTWMQLRQYTQRKLGLQQMGTEALSHPYQTRIVEDQEETSNQLTKQESEIFKAVYYQGRSIPYLAESLREEENSVRIQLKSAMNKMRRLRGN